MKVLIAGYKPHPRTGGTSTYIRLLSGYLEAAGHTPYVLAHEPNFRALRLCGRGTCRRFARTDAGGTGGEDPVVEGLHWERVSRAGNLEQAHLQATLASLRLDAFDLIHTQDPLMTRVFRALLATSPGPPLVASMHNSKSHELMAAAGRDDPHFRALETGAVRDASATLVPCRWLRDWLVGRGAPAEALHVVPYGIHQDGVLRSHRAGTGGQRQWLLPAPAAEVEAGDPLTPVLRSLRYRRNGGTRSGRERPARRPLIVCPARLVPAKGHAYLMKALASLRARGRRFDCALVGDGILREQLLEQATRLGIRNALVFAGSVPDADAYAWLARADVCCLPSIHDTFPFAVAEAQALGACVVSTRAGGIPEMVEHGRTGLLVPPADARALADALERVLADQTLRRNLAHAAQQHALAAYDLERMGRETLAVYRQVLEGRG